MGLSSKQHRADAPGSSARALRRSVGAACLLPVLSPAASQQQARTPAGTTVLGSAASVGLPQRARRAEAPATHTLCAPLPIRRLGALPESHAVLQPIQQALPDAHQLALQSIQAGDSPVPGSKVSTGKGQTGMQYVCVCVCGTTVPCQYRVAPTGAGHPELMVQTIA